MACRKCLGTMSGHYSNKQRMLSVTHKTGTMMDNHALQSEIRRCLLRNLI